MLFADSETNNAGWIAAAGVAVLAVIREVGNQMGLFATRNQAAVNEVVKAQGGIILTLQGDVRELKAENKECGRLTARLAREVIKLGGNPDILDSSGTHEAIAPEGADL